MIRKGLIWSTLALMAMLAIIFWIGANLPAGDQIPVHFDAKGNPDRYGSKAEAMMALWVLWGVTFFTILVLALVPKIMPRKANFEKSEKAYFAVWISTLVLMVAVTGLIAWTILSTASSGTAPIRFLSISMGILFVITGNYLPKTRSNWVIGIRTPWTLSSDYTWEKTQRVTGRLFLGAGLLTILFGIFASTKVALFVSVGSILAAFTFGIAYSWWVWRAAKDRSETSMFEP